MTSQQDTELKDILERFEYWKYVKMGGVLTNVLWEKSLDREQAIQALTSWKDKEVIAALEKAHRAGDTHDYDNATDEAIDEIIESLQSQGGNHEKANS